MRFGLSGQETIRRPPAALPDRTGEDRLSDPLVLLPPMMCDARVFAPQIEALSRSHVVIFAPIGGASRIEAIAAGILNKLPARFALAGMSMGGLVAMDILRQAPDRVRRICLMGCSPLPESPEAAAAREPVIVRAQTGRLEAALAETLRPEHLAPGPRRAEILALMHRMGLELGPEVFVRQIRALQRRRDQQATLRRAKLPALIACGAEDTLVPRKRHAFLAELMPAGQLQVIEGAGHIPSLEQPEAVTRMLRDWLGAPLVLR